MKEIIVLFVCCVSFSSEASSLCDSFFSKVKITYSKDLDIINSEIRPFWLPEAFSDPNQHDNSNFRYIVRVGSLDGIVSNVGSASVISNEFPHIYVGSKWAYIVKVPEANILISSPKDTGRQNTSSDKNIIYSSDSIKQSVEYYGLHTPGQLLKESIKDYQERPRLRQGRPPFREKDFYNEILFFPEGATIIGVLIFKRNFSPAGEVDFARLKANKLNVPLIELP